MADDNNIEQDKLLEEAFADQLTPDSKTAEESDNLTFSESDFADQPPQEKSFQEAVESGEIKLPEPGSIPERPRQDISPFSDTSIKLAARFKSAFGTKEGTISMLKKTAKKEKFEAVKLTEGGDIVIKKFGEWISYDPNQVAAGANPWDVSEWIADVADHADIVAPTLGSIAGGTIGSIGGGLTGAAVGALPGAAAGAVTGIAAGSTTGAVLGEMANQSFGRYLGTIPEDTSPDQLRNELVVEGFSNLLGLGFLPGAKLANKTVIKPVFKTIVSRPSIKATTEAIASKSKLLTEPIKIAGKRVLNPAGRTLAKVMNVGTGASSEAMENLLLRPREGLAVMNEVLSNPALAGASRQEIQDAFTEKGIKTMEGLLSNARTSLSASFRKAQTELLRDPDVRSFDVNVTDVGVNFFRGLEELGLGKVTQKALKGSPQFELISKDSLSQKIASGVDSAVLSTKSANKITKLVGEVNRLMSSGNLRGRQGAAKALEIRRKMDEIIFETKLSDSRIVGSKISEGIDLARKQLANAFGATSNKLGGKYNKMNAIWRDNVDAVVEAERVIRRNKPGLNTNSLRNFTKEFVGDSTQAGFSKRDLVKRISRISGASGKAAEQRLKDIHTSSEFFSISPYVRRKLPDDSTIPRFMEPVVEGVRSLGQVGSLTSPRRRAQTLETISRGAGLGAMIQEGSEQLGEIPLVKQWRDTIASMPLSMKDQLLSDPDTMAGMFQVILNAPAQQAETERQLLGLK